MSTLSWSQLAAKPPAPVESSPAPVQESIAAANALAATPSPYKYSKDMLLQLYKETLAPADLVERAAELFSAESVIPFSTQPLTETEVQILGSGSVNSEQQKRSHPAGGRGNGRGRGRGRGGYFSHSNQGQPSDPAGWQTAASVRKSGRASIDTSKDTIQIQSASAFSPLAIEGEQDENNAGDDLWDVPGKSVESGAHSGGIVVGGSAGVFASGAFYANDNPLTDDNDWQKTSRAHHQGRSNFNHQYQQSSQKSYGGYDRVSGIRVNQPVISQQHSVSIGGAGVFGVSGQYVKPYHVPAEPTWYYKDPQGNIQGPFNGKEMQTWFEAGYFPDQLLVKNAMDDRFEELAEYVQRRMNGLVDFMVMPSQPAPFYGNRILPQTNISVANRAIPGGNAQSWQTPAIAGANGIGLMKNESEHIPFQRWNQPMHHQQQQIRPLDSQVSSAMAPEKTQNWGARSPTQRAAPSPDVVPVSVVKTLESLSIDDQTLISPQPKNAPISAITAVSPIGSQQNAWGKNAPTHALQSPSISAVEKQGVDVSPKQVEQPQSHESAVKKAEPTKPVWESSSAPQTTKTLLEIQKEEELRKQQESTTSQQNPTHKRYADTIAPKSAGSVWGSKPTSITAAPTSAASSPKLSAPKQTPVQAVKSLAAKSEIASKSSSMESLYTAPSGHSTPLKSSDQDLPSYLNNDTTIKWFNDQLKPLDSFINIASLLEIITPLNDPYTISDVIFDAIGSHYQTVNPQKLAAEFIKKRFQQGKIKGGLVIPPPPENSVYALNGKTDEASVSSKEDKGFVRVTSKKKKSQKPASVDPRVAGAPVGVGGRTVVGATQNQK